MPLASLVSAPWASLVSMGGVAEHIEEEKGHVDVLDAIHAVPGVGVVVKLYDGGDDFYVVQVVVLVVSIVGIVLDLCCSRVALVGGSYLSALWWLSLWCCELSLLSSCCCSSSSRCDPPVQDGVASVLPP